MRIDLNSNILEQNSCCNEPITLDNTISSLSCCIARFERNSMKSCRADNQIPLDTTGKTATMGRRLLLSQIV